MGTNIKSIQLTPQEIGLILSGELRTITRPITPQPNEVIDGIPYRHREITVLDENYHLKTIKHPENEPDKTFIRVIPFPFPLHTDLWVKETWKTEERKEDGLDGIRYKTGNEFIPIENTLESSNQWLDADNGKPGWRSSIHLPQWAARFHIRLNGWKVTELSSFSSPSSSSFVKDTLKLWGWIIEVQEIKRGKS